MGYYRKNYEQFIGISTKSLEQQFYTLEEQVERYSRNLAYWYIQLEMDCRTKFKHPKHIQPKETFIKSQITRLMNTIKNIFPPDLPTLVHEMAVHTKHNILNEARHAHKEMFTPPAIIDFINQKKDDIRY